MGGFPNDLVWGYHGTPQERAEGIVRDGFIRSENSWDWLGHGVYFWERDFDRAMDWAAGSDRAVFAAVIDLSQCLDLTQMRWRDLLRDTVALAPADAADKLRQTGFNHGVDCWAINRVVNETRTSDGTPRFTTVRGAFQEGAPLFSAGSGRDKESAIRTLDHVQICVSDESAIRHLVQVTRPIVLD